MWPLAAVIIMAVFGVGGALALLSGLVEKEWRLRWRFAMVVVGGASLAGAVLVSVSVFGGSDALEARNSAIRENRTAFIENRGVYIPDSQMKNLEFPTYRPTDDEKFGIAQAEYQGKVISVFLTWEDDELKLYRTDGQELLPLG